MRLVSGIPAIAPNLKADRAPMELWFSRNGGMETSLGNFASWHLEFGNRRTKSWSGTQNGSRSYMGRHRTGTSKSTNRFVEGLLWIETWCLSTNNPCRSGTQRGSLLRKVARHWHWVGPMTQRSRSACPMSRLVRKLIWNFEPKGSHESGHENCHFGQGATSFACEWGRRQRNSSPKNVFKVSLDQICFRF